MFYILLFILALLIVWALLVWVRKTMWDAVHRNLLDLEDHLEGRVMRRSFVSRPFFHGKISNQTLTINFSSEKLSGKRITYIDISYAVNVQTSLTITDKIWLEAQNPGALEDFVLLKNQQGQEFILRPASHPAVKKLIKEKAFGELLDGLSGLAYIFIGKTGMICELMTEEVIKATELENMQNYLHLLENFSRKIG